MTEVEKIADLERALAEAVSDHQSYCKDWDIRKQIMALQSENEQLRKALRDVAYEAERPAGGLVHLKRIIALTVRQALSPEPDQ